MFKETSRKYGPAVIILLIIAGFFVGTLANNASAQDGAGEPLPPAKVVRRSMPAGSHTWDSDADFLAGQFEHTEVVPSTGEVTLVRHWTPNVEVNDDTGSSNQYLPSLVVDANGTFYATWHEDRNGSGNYDIYFARSTDGGQSWSTNVKVSDDTGTANQQEASIGVDANGNVYIAWHDFRNGNWDIYFAISTDNGQSWSANVKVNDDAGTAAQYDPSVAVHANGTVYVTWSDERDSSTDDIYFASSADSGATWSANVKVNDENSIDSQVVPSLAVDASGILYAAWADYRGSRSDIYFSRSLDGGTTWLTNTNVISETGLIYQYAPSLAVDASGNVVVAWQDERNGSNADDIYFARSTDGGTTWSTNVKVNDNTGSTNQYNPSLGVDGNGTLMLAWEDERNGNDDIYFARSTNNGTSWSANVKLNDNSGTSSQQYPSLAVDSSGNAVVIWQDARDIRSWDIYTTRSTDSGQSWQSNVKANDDPSTYNQYSPSVVVDANGTLYATWQDERHSWSDDIYFARSTDGGTTWLANTNVISETGSANQYNPSLAVDSNGNSIVVAWQDERQSGNDDIYFARSTDSGMTWGTNVKVNDDDTSTLHYNPSVALNANGTTAYVAWEDQRNNNQDIYFARSTDGGMTWGANVKVNDDQGTAHQEYSSLAVDSNGTLYLAWEDRRDGSADIYFATSTDGGTTWSVNVKINDDTNNAWQYNPSLAVDASGTVYVAWLDSRNSSDDIYFARSTDGGTTWSANVKISDDTGNSLEYAPSLAVDGSGIVYVAWRDSRNGNYDIYFARSNDGGENWDQWDANRKINDDSGTTSQEKPSLAVSVNGTAYAVWQDYRFGNNDIYAARWPDDGLFYTEGTYANDVFYDAGDLVSWNEATWTTTEPANTEIALKVRVGTSAETDIRWTEWFTYTTSPIDLGNFPPTRYLQWEAILSSPISTTTPSLEQVTVSWDDFSYTSISGGFISDDTTWQAANSPYLVDGNVFIETGATLTIEPGTTIWFGDQRALGGSIVALGTESSPITFTSWHANPQPDDWNDINFDDESVDAVFDADGNYVSGSALQYAIVEYGGGGDVDYAIDAPEAGPYIDHTIIRHNGAGGVRVAGVGNYITHNTISDNTGIGLYNNGHNATITDNTITSNANTGLRNHGNNATISHNTISGNAIASSSFDGGGIYSSASEVTIHDNTISDNVAGSFSDGGGIYNYFGSGTIYNNIITGNQAWGGGGIYNHFGSVAIYDNTITANQASYGGGIYNSSGSVTIYDNSITSNSASNGGGGIYESSSSNVTIRNNIISGNDASGSAEGSGVYWSGSGRLVYNTITNNTISGTTGGLYVNSGYPTIQGNSLHSNDGFQLANNNDFGDTHLDARFNWWNTTDENEVRNAIFDWLDDSSKSIVDYAPFLSQAAAPPTLSVTPTELEFQAPLNTLPPTQTLMISLVSTATQDIPTDWSVSRDSSSWWMSLTPASGIITGSGSIEVVVSVDTTFSQDSVYTGTITISAPGAGNNPLMVPVTLIVGSGPTHTPTTTRTPTVTSTPSATPSATPTATMTSSPSATPSATPTATMASSPSATSSATSTPSATPTAMMTSTPTITPSATPNPIASFPFADGFESGFLGDGWSVSTTEQGVVRVDDQHAPFAGKYGVLLEDTEPDETSSVAALILTIDLATLSDVALNFWWRDLKDENHDADGLFISDDQGGTWHRVLSFNNGPETYRQELIDLDAEASANGLTLTSHFQIKFQFYDDGSAPNDGYAIDEVQVRIPGPPPTPTPIPPDEYEVDNTCGQANALATDGIPQEHTFHEEGDQDWLTFSANSGTTYLIGARVPAGSEADVTLELYETCNESEPTQEQDHTFSTDVRMSFTPSASGTYYLRLLNNDAEVYGADVAYRVSIRDPSQTKSGGALIVVAGKYRDEDPLQSHIHDVTNAVYNFALEEGCQPDEVYYLAPDMSLDSNGDGVPDVNALASTTNLQHAITDWAVSRVGPERPLTLYLMDHGSQDELYLDGADSPLTSTQLDGWLDELESAVPGLESNIIIEACYSGSFISNPASISQENRSIMTSAADFSLAYASQEGAIFSDIFLDALRQGYSLEAAFDEGANAARLVHPDQSAWMDDNGDGIYTLSDGQLASRQNFACAEPVAELWPPYIFEGTVQANGEISAEVRDDQAVEAVWAIVYPPEYESPDSSTEMIPDPEAIALEAQGDDRYSITLPDLNQSTNGTYRIVLYASDGDGLTSRPLEVSLDAQEIQTIHELYLPTIIR